MFHKKDSCRGITLFRWFRWKLEFWYVPKDYECKEHTHKDSDGEFFIVYAKDREVYRTFYKPFIPWWGMTLVDRQQYNTFKRNYFKCYTVRANTPHGFSKGSSPMLFLCWETYKKGVKVTSPAVDFHLTNTI